MFEIYVLPAAQKDFDKLEVPVFARILKRIRADSEDARPPGCIKLTTEWGYRIQIGNYRILFRIDNSSKRIFIYRIKHREDVYS